MDAPSLAQYAHDASIVALAEALAHVQELLRRAAAAEAVAEATDTSALVEALDAAERRLFAHKDAFGVHGALFQRGCEELVLLSSAAGMLALRLGGDPSTAGGERERDHAGDLLTRAEQHTRRSGYLRGVPSERHASHRLALRLTALNNLACFHQRGGRPWSAIGALERALRLQLKLQTRSGRFQGDGGLDGLELGAGEAAARVVGAPGGRAHAVAITRLNLAAVLSQLERHPAAAEHARAAVAELSRAGGDADEESDAELLVIAYYNLAVELEHSSDRAQAQTAFRRALAVAEQRPRLLAMDLVAAIRRILCEYAAAPAPSSSRAKRGTPRTPRTPRGGGTEAQRGPPSPRRSPRRPLSPRSLRELHTP